MTCQLLVIISYDVIITYEIFIHVDFRFISLFDQIEKIILLNSFDFIAVNVREKLKKKTFILIYLGI